MSKKFLDSAGVQHLYSKIDSKMETFAQTIEETFVPETRMIAGIDLSKDISAENLKTQLNIGAGDSILVGTENPTVIGLTASENQLYLQTQNIDLADPAAILYIYTKDAGGNLIWLPLTEKFATVHKGYQTETPPQYATAHSMKIGDFYHLPSKPALYILMSADFTDEVQDEIECVWQEVALDQNVAAKTLKLSAAPTTTTNGSTGQLAYVVEYDGTKYSAPTYVCAAETNASGLTSWVSTMPDSDTLLHFLNKNNVVFEETGTLNVRAAYTGPGTDNPSLSKYMTGSYTLLGDYCFINATADLIQSWGVVYYHLPTAAVVSNGSVNLTPVHNSDTVIYLYSGSTLHKIKVRVGADSGKKCLAIEHFDYNNSSAVLPNNDKIEFTIIYKYR